MDATTLEYYFRGELGRGFKILDGAALSIILVALGGIGVRNEAARSLLRHPTATSFSSPSTRCAATRSAATAGRRARRTSTPWPPAASGFSFAHAQAVVTLPSHASILTGLYPFQHGYRAEQRLSPRRRASRRSPPRLKAVGFPHRRLRRRLSARRPLRPDARLRRLRRPLRRCRERRGVSAARAPRRRSSSTRAVNVDSAAGAADGSRGCTLYDPHAPYRPPPPFDRDYAGAAVLRRGGGGRSGARTARSPPRAPSSRPTLVVLTGDHGESLGEHGELTHGLFAYESTLHVPLIIAEIGAAGGPGGLAGLSRTRLRSPINPRGTSTSLPTILDALAMPCRPTSPATRCARAPIATAAATRASYFEAMESMLNFGFAPLDGVLAGREKYVRLPLPELYDLGADRARGRQPRRPRDGSRARPRRAPDDFHASAPGAPQPESPEVAARLRSLGYVSGSAAPKSNYSEQDDPKRLVEIDRLMHEAVALDDEGRLADGIARYRQILATASRHDGGVAPPRVRSTGASAMCPARSPSLRAAL